MAKKEKEKSMMKIDDKDYDLESLSNEQKAMVKKRIKASSQSGLWQTDLKMRVVLQQQL